MQEMTKANDITDVDFKEVPKEIPVIHEKALFNPIEYLCNALLRAGYPDPTGWTADADPRAVTADKEEDRIFFANRALRLFLAEIPDRENLSPRMLLADGIDSGKWTALMDQGIVPWLMNQFDKKGKRIQPTEAAATVDETIVGNPGSPARASDENESEVVTETSKSCVDVPEQPTQEETDARPSSSEPWA